ncbi:MAG: GGDEF domain-containing protein [Clostridia bacterium]|nr:GGDEF domain-containing protein [Clostridia bacterium]
MERIRHILFRSWYTLETLEDRIYHIILDVAVFASVFSVAAGLLQGQPVYAILSTALILLYLIVIQYITMRYPKHADTCRVLLVYGMNFVLFPIHFFTSGGIYSGMILFHLTGLVLCAMLIYGKKGGVVYLVSLVVLELSVACSFFFPELVQPMTEKQHLTNMMSTLFLSSVALYSIFMLIMRAYAQERKNNQELMEKLRCLSVMDALSGLYNRRELFRRLEVMYGDAPRERTEKLSRTGRYIAMFDVDNFKTLNDTYGHSFGDKVLVAISKELNDMARPEKGELAARYGGEEFVSILSADSLDEARSRVEETR